ncbi:MAG: hypothetical protein ACR2RV_05480 [Verrucomicrobiales bacterium]
MRVQAARYFLYSKSLLVGIMLGAVTASCFAIIVCGLAAMILFDSHFGWLVIMGVLGAVGSRLLIASLARGCPCQLCHGPVLIDKDCNKHRDASRYAPLSYRQSLLVDAALKGRFNCMYCGTAYRMWR